MVTNVKQMPVGGTKGGTIGKLVYDAAREVFVANGGAVEREILASGELIAYLYARSFPKAEWKARVEEAFEGMTRL